MHIVTRVDVDPNSSVRTYAKDAVGAVAYDQRQGVLIWRLADHLIQQLRTLTNRPPIHLEQAPPAEQQFYVGLAQTLYAITAAIDEAPPTPGEVRRYEQRKQLALARARARCEATRLHHDLDVFRPSEPGYELACCRHCRGGVSIHLDTGALSISEQLSQPCRAAR